MKKLIILFLIILPFFSFQYFEYKYRCQISGEYIKISLSKRQNYNKCLDVIKTLTNKIDDLRQNIEVAEKYYKKTDSDYWKQIYFSQKSLLEKLEKFRQKLLFKIEDFENNLFIKIKAFLNPYLMKKKNFYQNLLNNLQIKRKQVLLSGDEQELKQIDEKITFYNTLIALIDNILDSTNFYQLIPSLKLLIKYEKGN